MGTEVRAWLIDVVSGGIIGVAVGVVAAVNLVIFSGIDGGYEASIGEVLRQNPIIGVMTIALLVAGPIVGVLVARRQRRRTP